LEEHLENPVAEELFQGAEVDPRKRMEVPVQAAEASRHEGVQVGVEVDQVPESLDGDDHARDGIRLPHRHAVDGLQGIICTLVDFPEQPAIFSEVHPEDLGYGEYILAMGRRRQDLVTHPDAELEDTFLVTRGAEEPPLAREREEVLMSALVTADSGETFGEVPTAEEPRNLG
jgi:hypothetical protein